jgi:hypothetical protein
MKHLMAHFQRDFMPLFNGVFGINGDIYLCIEPVAYPPYPYVGDILHPLDMVHSMPDLFNNLRVYPVEKSSENLSARCPHDMKDNGSDQKSHDGIGHGVSEPSTGNAEENSKTC